MLTLDAHVSDVGTRCAPVLYDMHCHLDFAQHPALLAARLNGLGVSCLSVTVTPTGYLCAKKLMEACGNVCVGLGFHPRWVQGTDNDYKLFSRFERLVEDAQFIGEIGLDFGRAYLSCRDEQIAVLEGILAACAPYKNKVISIHAVHSTDVVLDVLEHFNITKNHRCIFHWFSGSSNDLERAKNLDCYFSVGARMLATKRGRTFVSSIPQNRLLLETDSPDYQSNATKVDIGTNVSNPFGKTLDMNVGEIADKMYGDLRETLRCMATLRRISPKDLTRQVACTSARLFGSSPESSSVGSSGTSSEGSLESSSGGSSESSPESSSGDSSGDSFAVLDEPIL